MIMCITPDFRQPLQSEYKDKYYALMTLTICLANHKIKIKSLPQIAHQRPRPSARAPNIMLSGAFKLVEAPVGTGGGVPVTFDVPLVVVGGLHRRERVIVQKRKLKLTFSTKCATPFLIGTSLFTILFPFAKYCPPTFVIVILPYVCPGTKSGKYPTKSKTTCPSMVSFEPNSLSGANTVIRGV
jgi:hypothetical protein